MIILMFIGASPGSTGGGYQVTTLAVIVMTVMSVVTAQGNAGYQASPAFEPDDLQERCDHLLSLLVVVAVAGGEIINDHIDDRGMSGHRCGI
jgi:Trk-type K+ transport system membrane component